ncbi:33179_t:CDS:2, partial [Racocetra persica]
KSKIQNTDACTQKWVRILQNYRQKKNISYDIQTLNDKEQLEHELCKFFANIKRQDGKPYKVKSIVSAYTSLRRFLCETSVIKNVNINDRFQFPILYQVVNGKYIELQDQGYSDQTAMQLTQKVFFWNAYLLGLHGGREKNNQGGLQDRNKYGKFSSRRIHIPADLPNNKFKPIQDLQSYVNLRPADAYEKFYLQLTRNSQAIQDKNLFLKSGLGRHTLANMMNDIAQSSKINITDQRITNHLGRRTAIQLLSDLSVNEHEMMTFSGHRSVNGLRSYK